MFVLGIDPGRSTGFALLRADSTCDYAFVSKAPEAIKDAESIIRYHVGVLESNGISNDTIAFVEIPVIYSKLQQKGDLNGLIKLALIAGGIAGYLSSIGVAVSFFTPQAWKGNTPKNINHARTLKKCPSALPLIERIAQTQQEHALDALGIALKGFER